MPHVGAIVKFIKAPHISSMKRRSTIARDLRTTKYRKRIVASRKVYNRKREKNANASN